MANGIKIGGFDFDALKIGGNDVDAAYIGDTLVYSGGTPPTPSHPFVDLGLPSGTLWATMNVGASSETDYGNYYQYGKGADVYSVTSGQSYYSGTEIPLATSADTAAQVWGGEWHMPTSAQCQELIDNTTYTWETNFNGSGINGGKFTSNTDSSKYVFFPAAGRWNNGSQVNIGKNGYYWSSSTVNKNTSIAYYLKFDRSRNGVGSLYRSNGFTVRPVMDNN